MQVPFNEESSSIDSCMPSYLTGTTSCSLKIFTKTDTETLTLVNESLHPKGYVFLNQASLTHKDVNMLKTKYNLREVYVYNIDNGKSEHIDTLIFKKEKKKNNDAAVVVGLSIFAVAAFGLAVGLTASQRK